MSARTSSLVAVCLVVSILILAGGCQTTARVVRAVFESAPSASASSAHANMTGGISVNPWPILGALLAFAGAVWGAITRDWQTGGGAMAAGMAMGLIGVAFQHPYAPLAGLILVIVGAGFKIRKYLSRNSRF